MTQKGPYVLGIDCGTQSLRAVVVDANGKLIASASRQYPIDFPHVAWAEQDADDWWTAAREVVPKAIAEAGIDAGEIAGLSVDGTSCTVVVTKRDGTPLLAEWPERELAVPVLDARRGELFAAVYRRRGAWVEPVAAPAALAPAAWWERIQAALAGRDEPVWGGGGLSLLVGEGSQLRAGLAERGEPVLRAWSATHPATARALAVAASAPASPLAAVHPFAAVPLYLRASEAEVKRRLDLTPLVPDPPAPPDSPDLPDSRGPWESPGRTGEAAP